MPGFIHNFVLSAIRWGLVPNPMQKAVDGGFVFRQEPTNKHRKKFNITTETFQDHSVHIYGIPKDGDPILYFCHGGGFVSGMFKSYYDTLGSLYRAVGCPVIAPDYPMPIETDAVSMRVWVLAHFKTIRKAYPNSAIIMGGDSAGANMALRIAQELGTSAKKDITALYILYGWLDLTRREANYPNHKEEVLLDATYMDRVTDRFRGDISADDPRISPLFGDMGDLPPVRIIAGDKDMLFAESLALIMRLRDEGHDFTHKIYNGYAHDFWLLPTPDGRRALREMAEMMYVDGKIT